MKTPGEKVFPYIQKNVDEILTIEDDELVDAFLDVMEKHKMVVENAGLLPIAALHHLDCKGCSVVPVLSGGNMDVITVSSLVQHGLINRSRIFTFSVQLPDRPGELLRVAELVAQRSGNIIKLDHNQFVNINRQSGVELKVTLEAFGKAHKERFWTACARRGMRCGRSCPAACIPEAGAEPRTPRAQPWNRFLLPGVPANPLALGDLPPNPRDAPPRCVLSFA